MLFSKRFDSMSQKLISSFFSANTNGIKRKNDKTEVKKAKRQCEEKDNTNIREQIIKLASLRPALSSNIGETWFAALEEEFSKKYFLELSEFLVKERASHTVYPPAEDVFSWTTAAKIQDTSVVILGQDPYHGPKQAHGLAFSVCKGVAIPQSLKNIFKELTADIPDFRVPSHGYLYGWASQGVLLLNTCLTVRASSPNSHQKDKVGKNWNQLTDAVIKWINENSENVVFMLWGKNAQEKLPLISKEKHLILCTTHPSPFSARHGFLGCRHFSKANTYLKNNNKPPIDWSHLP